jgi:hypothetical protein
MTKTWARPKECLKKYNSNRHLEMICENGFHEGGQKPPSRCGWPTSTTTPRPQLRFSMKEKSIYRLSGYKSSFKLLLLVFGV